jgi:hypothetical protein
LRALLRCATRNFMTVTYKKRSVGRPRLGDCRIECVVPQAVMNELMKREKQGKGYRTRIAANILTKELIGGVIARDGSLLRT